MAAVEGARQGWWGGEGSVAAVICKCGESQGCRVACLGGLGGFSEEQTSEVRPENEKEPAPQSSRARMLWAKGMAGAKALGWKRAYRFE